MAIFSSKWNGWEGVPQGQPSVATPRRSSRMFYSCHMQTLMSEWFASQRDRNKMTQEAKQKSANLLMFGVSTLSHKGSYLRNPTLFFLVKGPINLSKLPRFEKTHLLDLYASAWSLKKTTLEMENLDAICPPRCMMIELGNANSTCWGTNQDCLWLCTGLTDVLCFVRHFCYKERSCDPGVKVQDELGRQELKTVY